MVVRTSVGIQTCGTDDSAYIYESADDRWRRIWQSEQSSYEDKAFFPQRLVDVRISPTDWRPESDHTEHLIVTTGVFPWCSSVWQPIYYRVWETKSTFAEPRLLLDDKEQADIADPIYARASRVALVQIVESRGCGLAFSVRSWFASEVCHIWQCEKRYDPIHDTIRQS